MAYVRAVMTGPLATMAEQVAAERWPITLVSCHLAKKQREAVKHVVSFHLACLELHAWHIARFALKVLQEWSPTGLDLRVSC